MKKILLNVVVASLAGVCGAGEKLYNGIELPDVWPPRDIDLSTEVLPVPYLETANRPKVVPIDVGRQLFVDDFLVEKMEGLVRIYPKPVKYGKNPILKPETVVEFGSYPGCNPCAVPKGGGVWWDPKDRVFKMWYEGGWLNKICLATSANGLDWMRPHLSWMEESNVVMPMDLKPDSWSVIADFDNPDPSQRWKMYFRGPGSVQPALLMASADGISWTRRTITGNCDDRSSCFFNPFRHKWVYSLRSFWGPGGAPCRGRTRNYRETDDFFGGAAYDFKERENTKDVVRWARTDRLDAPDPVTKFNPQLYSLDAVAYESLMLGMFEIHHGPENPECEKVGLPKITDLQFAYSRDGFHWSRPDRTAAIRSERWGSGKWDTGYVQAAANLCVIRDEKLWFYYGAFRGDESRLNRDNWMLNGMYANGATGVAFLRRDGFVGLKAERTGVVTTRPLVFSGNRLFVNVDAPAGSLKVEVLDERGNVLPFTGGVVTGDTTKREVRFNEGLLDTVVGRAVRFRFTLTKGVLYSFWTSASRRGASNGYLAGGGPDYAGLRDVAAVEEEPADRIDPLVGTITDAENKNYGGHGLGKTFPGATMPFGVVQLSPDTVTGGDNGPGYSYTHPTIEGFSFTHMSGIGWYGDLGNFQVMPGTRATSRYSHDEECAEAGYYRVHLKDAKVTAELTAEPQAGLIRFTYEEAGEGCYRIDLARRIGELTRAKPHGEQVFTVTGPNTFEGHIRCDSRDGGWGRGDGRADYTMYFRGRSSKPLTRLERTGGSTNLNVIVRFPVKAGERVVLHVAVSFDRLPAMPEGFDFEGARDRARGLWNEALASIDVKGGSESARRIFSTALYHAFLDPRAIGAGDGFTRRTVFSGWDVFRSEMPLLTLIRPDIVRDTICSMAEVVTSGRRDTLPVWDLFGCKSDCMLGNPIIPVIATAVEAGITNFDVKTVYRLAKATSEKRGNDAALRHAKDWRSLSTTLEYAYDDWCMARLAERFGTPEDVRRFDERATWYRTCWDASVGWMRGWDESGARLKWEGRTTHGQGCAESNPYQQAWFVPHDPQGLAELMGGRAKFTEELERFFAATPKDFSWNDAYNHPNEPCHTVPFLFAFSDKPHLTGKWTRRICENAYGEGVYGLCGNDDVGQMSAWYVLASIGLHPLCPGSGQWIVTSPLFAETTLRFNHAYASAPKFTIRAIGIENPKKDCVKAIRLNGRVLNRPWVTTAEIFAGGTLEIELMEEPNTSSSVLPTQTSSASDWKLFDRRLGMFVHWGLYSVNAWHEQEWMRCNLSKADYVKAMEGFTAAKFDADELVGAAKSAGADYLVLTTKHHDGFCLWNTRTTDFNVMNTPAKRDLVKEIAAACKRQGVKLGFYYSNPDWHHPAARNFLSSHQTRRLEPSSVPDMRTYIGYVREQIRELLTNYGEIVCLFWDIPTKIPRPELNALVRTLQPGILIDDRGWGAKGDYSTPERGVPAGAAFPRATEACDSVGAQSWGYRANEDYRTRGYLTRAIDRTLSMGGNFLLNVGPRADGTLSDESRALLKEVGAWYARVRESYRDVETVPNLTLDGAFATRRGSTVYLHYPVNGLTATGLNLAPLAKTPRTATLLNTGDALEAKVENLPSNHWSGRGPTLHLSRIPAAQVADESPVIKLEFDGFPLQTPLGH